MVFGGSEDTTISFWDFLTFTNESDHDGGNHRTGNGLEPAGNGGPGGGGGGHVGHGVGGGHGLEVGGHNGGQIADDAADPIALTKQDFLVSFLVDARGGSMKGCRFSGVKVRIIYFFYFTGVQFQWPS